MKSTTAFSTKVSVKPAVRARCAPVAALRNDAARYTQLSMYHNRMAAVAGEKQATTAEQKRRCRELTSAHSLFGKISDKERLVKEGFCLWNAF